MASCGPFCLYMVLDYLVNGGLDVYPHAVDGVEGFREEPVTITDKCLLDPFNISLLPQYDCPLLGSGSDRLVGCIKKGNVKITLIRYWW